MASASTVLLVEVSDACGAHHPALQHASEDAESGRGILLVDVLASAWGSYSGLVPGEGKTVWCTCALAPGAPRPFLVPAPE